MYVCVTTEKHSTFITVLWVQISLMLYIAATTSTVLDFKFRFDSDTIGVESKFEIKYKHSDSLQTKWDMFPCTRFLPEIFWKWWNGNREL